MAKMSAKVPLLSKPKRNNSQPLVSREVPSNINAEAAAAFIKAAEIKTGGTVNYERDTILYPWVDMSPDEVIGLYTKISKKTVLKLSFIQKESGKSKKRLFEEALESYIAAYFTEHGIPND